MRKESTSPATKIFVSHVRRTKSARSPPTIRTIRPSSMYIDAAKSAGATSNRIDWMMYGPSVYGPGFWSAERARPMYPIVSTALGQRLSESAT